MLDDIVRIYNTGDKKRLREYIYSNVEDVLQLYDWFMQDDYCFKCRKVCDDYYMVTDDLWHQVHSTKGYLHLKCLEQIIKRPLVDSDFPDYPVNSGRRAKSLTT